MKKLLTFLGLGIIGVVGLCFLIGMGKYTAYRDNRMKCDAPLGPSATRDLGIALPAGVQVCRKGDGSGSASMELLVETPSPLCFASVGQIGCPSVLKHQLALLGAMSDAGWDTAETLDKTEVSFRRGKGETASVRFRESPFGEIAATMTVYFPATKLGKQ